MRRVASGSLIFSGAPGFFGPLSPGVLAGEARLKLFDLFFDFLLAVAGLKENVVRVSTLLFQFAATATPVGRVIFFIALEHAGELFIHFTAGQFHADFMLAEVVMAVDAQLLEVLQRSQGHVKAAIEAPRVKASTNKKKGRPTGSPLNVLKTLAMSLLAGQCRPGQCVRSGIAECSLECVRRCGLGEPLHQRLGLRVEGEVLFAAVRIVNAQRHRE